MALTFVSRAEWGARAPRSKISISLPTPRLWVHHSADDRQGAAAVRAHQDYHMDTKGWTDIAYSFLIGDEGSIFVGRGVGISGAHTAGDNSRSHGICLLGNFENHPPTEPAVNSLVALAQEGRDAGWWVPTLGGHRDAPGASTVCPGRHLYAALPDIRARVAGGPPPPPPPPPPPIPGGTVFVNVRVLQIGHVGGDVRSLQALLNAKAGQGLAVDGDFGPHTRQAVVNVQNFFRLTADGICGPKTWPTLFL